MDNKERKHSEPVLPEEDQETDFPGLPKYPPSEDIYNMGKRVDNIDAENIPRSNSLAASEVQTSRPGRPEEDVSGNDLDIPGAELDDNQEALGSEDEENNYYSIGSDNHNDLEEDNG